MVYKLYLKKCCKLFLRKVNLETTKFLRFQIKTLTKFNWAKQEVKYFIGYIWKKYFLLIFTITCKIDLEFLESIFHQLFSLIFFGEKMNYTFGSFTQEQQPQYLLSHVSLTHTLSLFLSFFLSLSLSLTLSLSLSRHLSLSLFFYHTHTHIYKESRARTLTRTYTLTHICTQNNSNVLILCLYRYVIDT